MASCFACAQTIDQYKRVILSAVHLTVLIATMASFV